MALSVSTFIRMALSGRTTDPVNANSTISVAAAMIARAIGRWASTLSSRSTKLALWPPADTAKGASSARISSTSVWLSSAERRGPRDHVDARESPRRPAAAADTSATPGRRPQLACVGLDPWAARRLDREVGGGGAVGREVGAERRVDLAAAGVGRQHLRVDGGEVDRQERDAHRDQQRRAGDRHPPAAGAGRSGRGGTRSPCPPSGPRGSAARWSRAGASAFTRSPSSARIAGSTIRATAQAISATIMPPSPIEKRKFCGNTISDAIAAATVSELNSTVRPAVARVRRSASRPGRGGPSPPGSGRP